MMDAELKSKWVAALRSGEYRQGKYALRSGSSFCCLGVLCVLADVAPEQSTESPEDGNPYEWVNQTVGPAYEQLVTMNDAEGKTFPEIADYIEANL
jgi:hypothetical protein